MDVCTSAAHAYAATHSAQAPAALLASQPCTLPARSGDPEHVDDVFANCLQLCLQAAAHAYAATHSAQAPAALLASQPCSRGRYAYWARSP